MFGNPDCESLPGYRTSIVLFKCSLQVMLSYGIRRRLQIALLDCASNPDASAHVMPSMQSIRSVLEELDVQDDGTQPPVVHTRRKFRRVFGLVPAADKLRLVGPLQIPPLG